MDKHMRMAKLVLAFSASLLMVAIAVHLLGASSTSYADTQIHGTGGIVALQSDWEPYDAVDGWRGYVLLEDGQVFHYSPCPGIEGFVPAPDAVPPVPVQQIKLWGHKAIVTLDNEVWVRPPSGTCGSGWENLGAPPTLPVATTDEPTSTLKRRY